MRKFPLMAGLAAISIIAGCLVNAEEISHDEVEEAAMHSEGAEKAVKNELAGVVNYKYYLDKGSSSILKKMKQMDMVIVDPVVMDKRYIKEAQQSGTIVYGYINAMEADKWNKNLFRQLEESDFYHKDGKRVYFSQWDSYLTDMTSSKYQDVLIDEIKRQVADKGLDGVFLDTVGNIDDQFSDNPETLKRQQEAMKNFMKRIKSEFPELSIGQNWGFDTLTGYTSPYVDFIMWEDFDAPYIRSDNWSQEKIQELVKNREKYGTEVFTITFEDEERSRKIAEKYGFKNYYNPAGSYYNKW
ncbi:endo alpha-1,4 polygalactosaminidase [Bacillus salacetis]|uniref:endo alpha-1,4 polygalactosaminidase n=1 Tax=Bacillus salacetis TaxID=2315464 RepID=UPI003B9F71C6